MLIEEEHGEKYTKGSELYISIKRTHNILGKQISRIFKTLNLFIRFSHYITMIFLFFFVFLFYKIINTITREETIEKEINVQ